MEFSEEIINDFKADPIEKITLLCEHTIEVMNQIPYWDKLAYGQMFEAYALICELIELKILPIAIEHPEFEGNLDEDSDNLFRFLHSVVDLCASARSP